MRNKCQTEHRTTCSELKGDGGGMADGDLNFRAERTRRNAQHRQTRWCFRVWSHFPDVFRVACPQQPSKCFAVGWPLSQWTGSDFKQCHLLWHSEAQLLSTLNQCSSLHEPLLLSFWFLVFFSFFLPLRTQNDFWVTTLSSLVNT